MAKKITIKTISSGLVDVVSHETKGEEITFLCVHQSYCKTSTKINRQDAEELIKALKNHFDIA